MGVNTVNVNATEMTPAREYFDVGVKMFHAERWEDAISCFQIALKLQPKWEAALYGLAQVSEKLGHWHECLRCYRGILEVHGHDACWVYAAIGDVYLKLDSPDRAIESTELAKRNCQVVTADVYRMLGDAWLHKKNAEEAIEAYQEAIALAPDSGNLHFKLGELYRKEKGDLEQATNCYQNALKLDRTDAWAHHCLADCFTKQGRLDEAIDLYRTAVELKPEAGWIQLSLGKLLCDTGNFVEALDCLAKAETYLERVSAEVLRVKGKSLFSLGRLDEAEESYRAAIAMNPTAVWAYVYLGRIYRRQQNIELAIEQFRKAHEIKRDSPRVLQSLGELLYQNGELKSARHYLEEAVELQPNLTEAKQLLELVNTELDAETQLVIVAETETKTESIEASQKSRRGWLSKVFSLLKRNR